MYDNIYKYSGSRFTNRDSSCHQDRQLLVPEWAYLGEQGW